MGNNPESVFDKLDKQSAQIDDISSKLAGINVDDLYALAKRTWDYGDYETAQKYYNHISLLRPLDWEAPLYASLCNFYGPHDVQIWNDMFERVAKIFVSTFKYIDDLKMSPFEKNKEMSKCAEIVKNHVAKTKKAYSSYKKIIDKNIPDVFYKMETFDVELFELDIDLESMVSLKSYLAEDCLNIIETTRKKSPNVTDEVFNKMTKMIGRKE